MSKEDIKYWVGFSLISGIGRVRFNQLENYFTSLENAWKANPAELKQAGLDSGAIRAITSQRPKISLEAEMEKLERYGVKVLTCHDKDYPSRLKEVYDYPPLIYVRGSLLPEDEWCLAVVGTRRATVYGRQVTEEIVADLAQSKITIVSGLAKGIDTVAHHSALEAGGRSMKLGDHAATLVAGSPGVLHGSLSYVLQDADGQTAPVHSISAGLDYPGVGPEHSQWKETGRVRYTSCSDAEALDATMALSRAEGIIPALESAHAVAEAMKLAPKMEKDKIILINLSGRGDKDCNEIAEILKRRGDHK